MKILVADDDALIRRLLLALLTKLGHQVETVEEGHAALSALERPSPPDLTILDWVMPGLNGVEVCRKLRAQPSKARPYVLLLSAKSDRNDIIAGLDAGADDYLVKPFDPMALLARLRVAHRIICYHQELQRHIGDMETLLQRHNLLGELFNKQGQGRGAETPSSSASGSRGTEASRAAAAGAAKAAVPNPAVLAPEKINAMFIAALAEIGLHNAEAQVLEEKQGPGESVFTAWAPLILLSEGLWVDLLLEADDSSAVSKFESLLGRIPVSERELLDFLAETFNLLCTSVKASLANQGVTVFMPVISRSIRTTSLAIRVPALAKPTRHRFTLPEIRLTLSVIRQPALVVQKTFGQLRELDLLAENLPSPSTTDVFLLNQGVMMNSRYIDKLVSLAQGEKRDIRVPVVQPSPLTEFFCLGRISES